MRNNCCVNILCFVFSAPWPQPAQSFPKVELAGGYTYGRFHPNLPALTSQNLNGGGGAVVYNITDWFGVKAEFMGYGFGSSWSQEAARIGLCRPR